jgi:3-oxoacyl-[acyl-carrier-protein] synthase II
MGAVRAMKMALESSGIDSADIDYINAHGTSTFYNDRVESEAIRNVFGNSSDGCKVSSTKSVTGHLLGAAASLEFIACVMALREQVIPPTANLDNLDPECALNHVPNEPLKSDLQIVMSNSFGFGGHNISLVLKKYG